MLTEEVFKSLCDSCLNHILCFGVILSLTHNVDLYSYHVFVSVILIQITYPKIIKHSGIASHTQTEGAWRLS